MSAPDGKRFARFGRGHAHYWCAGCTDECEYGPCCEVNEVVSPAAVSTPDGFEWETRALGEHDWRHKDGLSACALCGARAWEAGDDPCPSVQERRLVGPWEPVEEPS